MGQIANESRSTTASLAFGRAMSYDGYGRFSQRTTSIAGMPYLEIIAYDTLGRPSSQRDAAGYTLTSHYSTAGYVQSLGDSRVNGDRLRDALDERPRPNFAGPGIFQEFRSASFGA